MGSQSAQVGDEPNFRSGSFSAAGVRRGDPRLQSFVGLQLPRGTRFSPGVPLNRHFEGKLQSKQQDQILPAFFHVEEAVKWRIRLWR
jgi:hypothetical protein